jgi:hypothetical protein
MRNPWLWPEVDSSWVDIRDYNWISWSGYFIPHEHKCYSMEFSIKIVSIKEFILNVLDNELFKYFRTRCVIVITHNEEYVFHELRILTGDDCIMEGIGSGSTDSSHKCQ